VKPKFKREVPNWKFHLGQALTSEGRNLKKAGFTKLK